MSKETTEHFILEIRNNLHIILEFDSILRAIVPNIEWFLEKFSFDSTTKSFQAEFEDSMHNVLNCKIYYDSVVGVCQFLFSVGTLEKMITVLYPLKDISIIKKGLENFLNDKKEDMDYLLSLVSED